MATYRNIQMTFWTDIKVADDFTADDRYVYLYLLTNPHTNLCGCYEVSQKQIASDTGLPANKVKTAMKNLAEKHRVISYSPATREVLIINWYKYNWTSSDRFRKPLEKHIQLVKDESFRTYLIGLYNGMDTVSIPYPYGTDTTVTVTVNVTDTVSVTDTVPKTVEDIEITGDDPRKYGSMGNVLLTENEYASLVNDYGEDKTRKAVDYLDLYIPDKGYKVKSPTHYLAIRRWVMNAVEEQQAKAPRARSGTGDEYRSMLQRWATGGA